MRLTVEDSGPGVADAALPRVFDRFYRGDAGRRGTSGTGIGLAVVRGFVEAMGGRVSARRGELGGLAVDIELPATSIPADVPELADADAVRDGAGAARPARRGRGRNADARSQRHLAARGYRVDEAHDVGSALTRWAARRPDVILLDLGLPDRDGTDLIRRVRREAETPILVLSARDAERTKVEALELGADDYVTKPFGTAELLARLRALLRRAAGPAADAVGRIGVGPLVLDAGRHAVTVDGRPVELTPREFEVLRVLLTHQGRLVTRGRLLRAVWGEAYQDEDHYVHVYVSQLRRKLAAADETGALRDLIVTEPGIGYRVRGPERETLSRP